MKSSQKAQHYNNYLRDNNIIVIARKKHYILI